MAAEEGAVVACHTKEEFETQMAKAKEASKLVIIDFTASWCGPCRIMSPVFIDYAKKFPDAIFLKVDVDELKDTAAKYNVEAMPTFMFIKGDQLVETIIGARKEELNSTIVRHLGAASA